MCMLPMLPKLTIFALEQMKPVYFDFERKQILSYKMQRYFFLA